MPHNNACMLLHYPVLYNAILSPYYNETTGYIYTLNETYNTNSMHGNYTLRGID